MNSFLSGLGLQFCDLITCFTVSLFRLYTVAMRYYEQKYPEVDELVMVQVRQIAEMGAYVKLVGREHSLSPRFCSL